MRGLKELLPLLIVVVIVTVILLSWLRSGAQFIARSRSAASGTGIPAPGTFVTPTGSPPGAVATAPSTPDARLRQITMALLMYAEDYNRVLPPMTNPTHLEFLLLPYVRQPHVFLDPMSATRFGVNAHLSFQSLNAIPNPADIVVFYQQKPDPKTKERWVAFLDGHVKRVNEKRWQQLSKASGIGKKPAPPKAKSRSRQH